MKVIWLPQAKKQLRQTAKYILREFGQGRETSSCTMCKILISFLQIIPTWVLLNHSLLTAPQKYRSCVVNRLNKIVYFIKDDHIEVADFWDVRREPQKLAQGL